MPRTARAAVGGVVYHVFNRGNNGMALFREPEDYLAFLQLLRDGKEKARIELFGFCLMPNHWHMVLRPARGRDLSSYLSWVSNTHVKRYRARYRRTSGHLYEGRYKSFPVEVAPWSLALLQFVESNPLRAKLVPRARDWPWSSLGCERGVLSELLDPWPVDRPRNWAAVVNRPLAEAERQRIVDSLERGRPLGSDAWSRRMAARLGLQYTLNPRGRPRKPATKITEITETSQ
jgi:putative transposase